MDIKTEWQEPVPQPEPPKRTVTLLRDCDGIQEPATLDDISKALGGISKTDLVALMTHGSISGAYNAWQANAKLSAYQGQALQSALGITAAGSSGNGRNQ